MLATTATRNSVTSGLVISSLSSSRLLRVFLGLHPARRPDGIPCASAPLDAILGVATAWAAPTASARLGGLERLSVSATGSRRAAFAYSCKAASCERRGCDRPAVQREEPRLDQERLRMLRAALLVHGTANAAAHAAAVTRNAVRGSTGRVGAGRACVGEPTRVPVSRRKPKS